MTLEEIAREIASRKEASAQVEFFRAHEDAINIALNKVMAQRFSWRSLMGYFNSVLGVNLDYQLARSMTDSLQKYRKPPPTPKPVPKKRVW